MAKQPQTKQTNAPAQTTAAPVTETAITPADTQAKGLTSAAPAWLVQQMQGRKAAGLEQMDSADLIISRLVLAQSMSPEVTNADENGYGIDVGDIFDNLTKEVRAKAGDTLTIIPVVLGKSRIHFGDLDKDEGILCRSNDALTALPGGDGKDAGGQPTRDCAKCILKEFDDEADGRPACSLFYNIIVLLPDFGMIPAVWSNKHTNVKVAKRFLSTAKLTGADLFAQKYTLKSVKEKNDKYTYQNFDFKPMGWVTEEEYRHARGFYDSLSEKTWAADTSDMEGPNDVTEKPVNVDPPAPKAPAPAAPAKATPAPKGGDVPF